MDIVVEMDKFSELGYFDNDFYGKAVCDGVKVSDSHHWPLWRLQYMQHSSTQTIQDEQNWILIGFLF